MYLEFLFMNWFIIVLIGQLVVYFMFLCYENKVDLVFFSLYVFFVSMILFCFFGDNCYY